MPDDDAAKVIKQYEQYEKEGAYDNPDVYPWSKEFLEECEKAVPKLGDEDLTVLDIGTGGSVSLMSFIKRFSSKLSAFPVVTIDSSRTAIKLSKAKLAEKRLDANLYEHVNNDARILCLIDRSFNLVSSVLTLHEISQPGKRVKIKGQALSEMLRVCAMYGFLIMVDSVSDFRNHFWKHTEDEKKKGKVSFTSGHALQEVFHEILPNSYLLVRHFRSGRSGRRGTLFFVCVVRKSEEIIVNSERIRERLKGHAKWIAEQLIETRARASYP